MHIIRSATSLFVFLALANGLVACSGGSGSGDAQLATVSPDGGGTGDGTGDGTTITNTANSTGQNSSSQSNSTTETGAAVPGTVMTAERGRGLETGTVDPADGLLILDDGGPHASLAVVSADARTLTLPDGRQVSLVAGSVNADNSRRFAGALAGGGSVVLASYQSASNLSYSDYGSWAVSDGASPVGLAVYAVGTATPVTQMPITGGASYQGGAAGGASIGGSGYTFTGHTALTADFGLGSISGRITGLQATTSGGHAAGRMNDIALSGAIAGNGFSGTADPGAADSTTALDIGGTNGSFGGSFNGPAAQEVAGTFRLEGGGDTIAGSFGAHR